MTTTIRATPKTELLLVVDGNSIAHRAYHAMAPRGGGEQIHLQRDDGHPTAATYGFCSMLASACRQIQPTSVLVGFDDHRSCRRRDLDPAYKADRRQRAMELEIQMLDIQHLLVRLGIQVLVPLALEADDVLGSAAYAASASAVSAVLLTSDRDAFSLISETVSVVRPGTGKEHWERITPPGLYARYGITPAQYPDYAALRGDPSDGLAGVAGIGEKRAAALLHNCTSVAAALAELDRGATAATIAAVGPAAAKRLMAQEARAVWQRNRTLMALVTDVPVDLEACRLTGPPQGLEQIARDFGLVGVIPRLARELWGAADPF